MAQSPPALLAHAVALEEAAVAFYRDAKAATEDPYLAATFQFLESQHRLACHQLADEQLRLDSPAPAPKDR